MAAERGLVDVATLLITAAAAVAPPGEEPTDGSTINGTKILLGMKDKNGNTPLHAYAQGQYLTGEMVRIYISHHLELY